MRFASLGSGSAGNALIVEAGATRVMLDCGFGLAATVRRLERIGVAPESVTSIVVTHEHDDHVGGVSRFARRYGATVHLTYGTLVASGPVFADTDVAIRIVDGHGAFAIDDLEISPFPVPHDAREPVQYVIGDGVRRLGVLTDTGSTTGHIEAMLSGVEALVLECNYDEELLRSGGYPPVLQRRIAGRLGHLENRAAADLLSRLDASRLQHLVAAHLSRKNNDPARARGVLAEVLGCTPDWIGVADQDAGFGWRSLG